MSAFSFSGCLALAECSFRAAGVGTRCRPGRLILLPRGRRRHTARMSASNNNNSNNSDDDENMSASTVFNEPGIVDGDYDELKSDEDYIVVDGKDVAALIKAMQVSGEDALLALEDELLPEDEGVGRSESTTTATTTTTTVQKKEEEEGGKKGEEEEIAEKEQAVMEYFTDENLSHMPKWAREAYVAGKHGALEEASHMMEKKSRRRLHALVESGEGISDCRVAHVAEDYDVPVEFVCDVLLELGVKSPRVDDIVSQRCNRDEIGTLLHLISSFDAKDLDDRYSDRTLAELAEDYDLDLATIEQLCADEQIYCARGEHTRLQVTREDRVLDILLRDSPMKKPYPSLLEGLFAAA